MISNLVKPEKFNKTLSLKEKKKLRVEFWDAVRKEVSNIKKISVTECKKDVEKFTQLKAFDRRKEDAICAKYDLPVDNYADIMEFVKDSYFLHNFREVCLLLELYKIDKEFFSEKQRKKFVEILMFFQSFYDILKPVLYEKNIKRIAELDQQIADDKELLKKYNELIFSD